MSKNKNGVNLVASAIATLMVYGCGWSINWLINRYFHDGVEVTTLDMALFMGIFATWMINKYIMDKDKKDGS